MLEVKVFAVYNKNNKGRERKMKQKAIKRLFYILAAIVIFIPAVNITSFAMVEVREKAPEGLFADETAAERILDASAHHIDAQVYGDTNGYEAEYSGDDAEYAYEGQSDQIPANVLRSMLREKFFYTNTQGFYDAVEPEWKIIKVPPMNQNPDYPSGCESVAAVMLLNYLGFDVTASDFIENYLPTGYAPRKIFDNWFSSDPDVNFLGEPTSRGGWGIWAKGMASAVSSYIKDNGGGFTITASFSDTLDSLCDTYVKNDIPVLVWVTVGMETPRENITARVIGSDKTFTWISPNHCMLLVGYDETGYYFNDPMTGRREKYSKADSINSFTGNGSQALIIQKK